MGEISRLFKYYYILDVVRLLKDRFLTKVLFSSKVKMIRQPAYVIGKQFIEFGKDFQAGVFLRIEIMHKDFVRHPVIGYDGEPFLKIGNNVSFNNNVHIGAISEIIISDNVLVGSNVLIIDHNHGVYKGEDQDAPETVPRDRKAKPEKIFIGKNVWIGDNVSILQSSHIGNGCIIAANSVVCGKFGDNLILAGTPAKAIKQYDNTTKKWIRIS